jgi:NAD-dependent SIR2 family protein deacetylase
MALSKLVEKDICKFIVSTNGDGLHIRSEVPVDKISELHGDAFKYRCHDCKTNWYFFPEMKKDDVFHCIAEGTCPKCYAKLYSTGVGFGSDLPPDEWQSAKLHSSQCDLALVMGTSMRVAPGRYSVCKYILTSYSLQFT